MTPLQVIRTPEDYLTLRCGPTPSDKCKNDPSILEGNTGMYMNRAIHNGQEVWEEQTAALIFSAGAGGYAGANFYPNDTGFAIVGDWALEPISGKANDWGISCKYATWQCNNKVAKGTPAHELAHSFGLGHPPSSGPTDQGSIMIWHGGYPEVSFLPFEKDYLKQSPFFNSIDESSASATPTPGSLSGKGTLIESIIRLFGGSGNPSQGDQNNDGILNELDFGAVYSR